MHNCGLTLQGSKALSRVCTTTPQLTMLVASDNRFGDAGLEQLAHGLQHCKMLKVLALRFTNLSLQSMPTIIKLLRSLSHLEELYLYGNDFSGDGPTVHVSALCHAAKQHGPTLKKVDMRNCGLSPEAHSLVRELQFV